MDIHLIAAVFDKPERLRELNPKEGPQRKLRQESQKLRSFLVELRIEEPKKVYDEWDPS